MLFYDGIIRAMLILGASQFVLFTLRVGGGILFAFGTHIIDLVSYLTGQKASRVHGVTRTITPSTSTINGTRRITSPDFVAVQMQMENC